MLLKTWPIDTTVFMYYAISVLLTGCWKTGYSIFIFAFLRTDANSNYAKSYKILLCIFQNNECLTPPGTF